MLQAAKTTEAPDAGWLTRYYATRAGVSVIWVAAAFALGKTVTPLAAILLVLYPAWDAAANITDASRNGGLRANLTQAFNAIASAIVTIAVGVASAFDAHAVFYIFGGWAFLAGLLQLATAIRRWAGSGAQWPMILSGAQSALAGAFFIKQAADGIVPTPADIAPTLPSARSILRSRPVCSPSRRSAIAAPPRRFEGCCRASGCRIDPPRRRTFLPRIAVR